MAYTVPSFPIPVSVWRFSNWSGVVPPASAPDVIDYCNLVPGRRQFGEGVNPSSYLLCPFGLDVRFSEAGVFGPWPPVDPDLVEVPTGSGRFYTVADVEFLGLGFPNQHKEAIIVKASPFNVTYAADVSDYILLEDGTELLLENGSFFLLE